MGRYDGSTDSQGRRVSNRSLSQYADSIGDGESTAETDGEVNDEAVESKIMAHGVQRSDGLASDASVYWPVKKKRRNLMLLCLASFLVSIAQSIIMPVIKEIAVDLNGSNKKAAALMVWCCSPCLSFCGERAGGGGCGICYVSGIVFWLWMSSSVRYYYYH